MSVKTCCIYICICGFRAPVKKCAHLSFTEKSVSWKHGGCCIRQPTEPYFQAHWSSDLAVFLVYNLPPEMEDGILIQRAKISWQPCRCIYQTYSHLFVYCEMKHAEGITSKQLALTKVPCSIAPLKTCLWQKPLWLNKCRTSQSKMQLSPGQWAHRLGNNWVVCLQPSALSRKSLVSLFWTGGVENTRRSMKEQRLPDSSFNILPASTHLIWSPHLTDVSWFFCEKQNIMPSFLL